MLRTRLVFRAPDRLQEVDWTTDYSNLADALGHQCRNPVASSPSAILWASRVCFFSQGQYWTLKKEERRGAFELRF